MADWMGMPDVVRDPSASSSRRSVLKKGLVAGGIAWTAPVIATLSQPVAAAVGSTAGSYTYCFDDGASGTLEGWSIDNTAGAGNGLWNVSGDRSVSGGFSLHYGTGTGGDYNTGGRNAGTVTSPSFTVPAGAGPTLVEFDVWREVEVFGSGNWDEFSVSILGGSTRYSVARDGGTTSGAAFEHVTFDISDLAGSTIQLVFAFDTGDGSFNNFEGVYVDNIIVPGATAPGGGGVGVAGSARSLGIAGWMPNRPEPSRAEQRRRDRAIRSEKFEAGVLEEGVQAAIKTDQ